MHDDLGYALTVHLVYPQIVAVEDDVNESVLRYDDYVAYEIAGLDGRVNAALGLDGAQNVLDMHRSDDVIGRFALVDGIPGVVARGRQGDELSQGRIRSERHDVGAGDHDLAGHLLVEL